MEKIIHSLNIENFNSLEPWTKEFYSIPSFLLLIFP